MLVHGVTALERISQLPQAFDGYSVGVTTLAGMDGFSHLTRCTPCSGVLQSEALSVSRRMTVFPLLFRRR
jgi:hypothetical protein